jgi:hypothetical protein
MKFDPVECARNLSKHIANVYSVLGLGYLRLRSNRWVTGGAFEIIAV